MSARTDRRESVSALKRQIGMAIEGAWIVTLTFGSLALVNHDGSVSLTDWLASLVIIAVAALLQRSARGAWRKVAARRRRGH